MLTAALATVAAAVSVSDGVYRGEGARVVVEDRRVVRLRTTVRRYVCDPFGQIGPLPIALRPGAAIDPRGRARFVDGPPSERVAVALRFRASGRATARLRVRGTIGTGDPCRSPRVRVALHRRG